MGRRDKDDVIEPEGQVDFLGRPQMTEMDRVKGSPHHADAHLYNLKAFTVQGSWIIANGSWWMVHGSWSLNPEPRTVIPEPREL
jgi:hypothetical protein